MLPNVSELMLAMKRAALDAVEASKPVNVCFGEVVSASPLKIKVEQKMTLGKLQLILSRNVTEFTLKIKHEDESSEKITIKNALKKGEKVILIRQQKGQKYIVVDRIGGDVT